MSHTHILEGNGGEGGGSYIKLNRLYTKMCQLLTNTISLQQNRAEEPRSESKSEMEVNKLELVHDAS